MTIVTAQSLQMVGDLWMIINEATKFTVPVRSVRCTLQKSFFIIVPATAALVRLVAESTGNIQKVIKYKYRQAAGKKMWRNAHCSMCIAISANFVHYFYVERLSKKQSKFKRRPHWDESYKLRA